MKHTGTLIENDIALIRLNQTVQLSPSIRTICLPLVQQPKLNDTFTVMGFGRTENSLSSNILLKAKLPQVSYEDCKKIFPNTLNEESVVCAGGEKSDSAKG